MVIKIPSAFNFPVKLILFLSFLLCTLCSTPVTAETVPTEELVFPGLDEVIPRATSTSARLAEATAIVNQSESLESAYLKLDELAGKLNMLEEQFSHWDDAVNWPLNRLMTAEARYEQIGSQLKENLEPLFKQLEALEEVRKEWSQEKEFWLGWHKYLKDSGVSPPIEAFEKAHQAIEGLLKRVATASGLLIKKQEQFSPSQELLTGRLSLINSTLAHLRLEPFRRNAYSLFSMEFYNQFTPELFKEYRNNIISTIRLPDGFWQSQGWLVILQMILVAGLTTILFKRNRKTTPLSPEWQFLFRHPIAGAAFITMIFTGALYEKIPPSWGWLLQIIGIIAGTILVVAMLESPLQRRLIRVVAIIYLFSEALKVTGLPTPAYQLFQIIIYATVTPICLWLASHRGAKEQKYSGSYRTFLYLVGGSGAAALVTALFGFATLSTHLIDAILGTVIIIFLARMAIHLANGGVTELLRLPWIKERQFVCQLGAGTADRLKKFAHIIIVTYAVLFVPIAWGIYDTIDEVSEKLLAFEYTIGDFTISLYMVIMFLLVIYLTNLISWIVQALADAQYMTPQKMELGVKTAMKRLLHYSLFTVGFFVAISMAGLDLQKFTIIAGALGVGIGFGLQNIVNNFVSGLILLFERPVKVGDIINIDETWGTITSIGLRSTVFETLDRAEIIVPNSELISQKVTNWTFTTNVSRIVLTVGVAYGSPLDKVLELMMLAANENPSILEDPAPSAIFTNFGDSSLDFELRVWVSDINLRLSVKSELGRAIDRLFREHGITIPFPQRDLHIRSIDVS